VYNYPAPALHTGIPPAGLERVQFRIFCKVVVCYKPSIKKPSMLGKVRD
jgi:hypothetical protein